MPLELHIWGPAFGLPSIDAECLAAIAYLRHSLGNDEWVLVASCDPSVSPTRELPALKSGSLWVSRYRNIVDYLRKCSSGRSDLDRGLDKLQKADSTAFSSFLESRGLPLLDLSLYVSSENYRTCTRSALAEILPWPNQWITPPKLRAAAKKRSQHLNLSSLDLDDAHDDITEESKLTAQIPKSLRKPKQTVTSMLGKSTHGNQFRLDAVTSNFLEPLNELLADKEWFIGETITSLDCLALGYLALLQSSHLPLDWLNRALKEKYPRLGRWTEKFSRDTFGRPVAPSDAFFPSPDSVGKNALRLPWQAPTRPTVGAVAFTILENTMDALPVIGQLRTSRQLKKWSQDSDVDDIESKQLLVIAESRNRELFSQVFAIGAGMGVFVGYLFWVGMLKIPRGQRTSGGRRDFGTAGAMLGLR